MEAMIERAKQLAIPIVIAIVDDAGNLKAYVWITIGLCPAA
jgi:uncharacterized protein GlcG (DUF336 family)